MIDQQVEAGLDRREGEHREPLEVERLGDVLEASVELADDVVVRDEHVVEEDLVGPLVAHRPDRLDGEAGVVHRHEEQRDAEVLRDLGVGAGADPVPVGEVRRGGPDLLAGQHPAVLDLEPGVEHEFKIIKMSPEEKKVGLSIRAVGEEASRSEVEAYKQPVSSTSSTIGELINWKRASNEGN